MLNACDEVWAPSTYSAEILRAHGVANVYRVPAPIDTPPRLATVSNRMGRLRSLRGVPAVRLKISNMIRFNGHAETADLSVSASVRAAIAARQLFVTVLNPHDRRKNLQELLLGFATITNRLAQAALIVKLVLPKRAHPSEVLTADIAPRFERPVTLACDRILFVSDYLEDDQLQGLYQIADFYLCASVAEGQEFPPLIEAMGQGVIAVSTLNTAMRDYLSDRNCIAISTRPFSAFERRMGADVVRKPYTIAFCSQTDIGRAVLRACSLSSSERERLRLKITAYRSGAIFIDGDRRDDPATN